MLTGVFPDLENLALGEQEPEYVLAFWPPSLYGRLRDRLSRTGWWELLTVAEYEHGSPARDEWSIDGHPDSHPLLLAAWAKTLLGFPVTLEPGEHSVRTPGIARWHRVPLYLARRNT
jgi:hypothetical protein